MKDDSLMEMLGRAFACGETEKLAAHLAPECSYESEYGHRTVETAEKIIEMMKEVNSFITEECRYTYQCVALESILREIRLEDMAPDPGTTVCPRGLLLYQYSDTFPAAVVVAMLDANGKIKRLLLSRNTAWFRVDFYMEECSVDAPDDRPATVRPLTPHDRQVRELRHSFSGQHLDEISEEPAGDCYVWNRADVFLKSWLARNGYVVLESRIFEDCIGYRCWRNQLGYTVYLYAYGQKNTTELDGAHYEKLSAFELSRNSTVLVTCLNVKRYRTGDKFEYRVCRCGGNKEAAPELWRLAGNRFCVIFPDRKWRIPCSA